MFTKKIKKILIDRDLTVGQLAREIGVSREWVSYTINGHWRARAVPTRIKIAKFLGLSYRSVWGEPEPREAA